MTEKVTFKFFEGRDVDQFTFYRIPKQLFTVSYFKGLSSDAKILYGLMLDRISLSVKNHWFDEENRAYIYFSIDDVMELLGVGKNKAVKCLKELDVETGIGLTQKRRQGFGKSNMIYVKTFLVESRAEMKEGDNIAAGRDIWQEPIREPKGVDVSGKGASMNNNITRISPEDNSTADYDNVPEYADEEFLRENYASFGPVQPLGSMGNEGKAFNAGEKPVKAVGKGATYEGKQTSVETDETPRKILEQTSLREQEESEMVIRPGDNSISAKEMDIFDQIQTKTGHISPETTWEKNDAGSFTGQDVHAEKFSMQTTDGSGTATEVYIVNNKKFTNETSRIPHNKLIEVCFEDPNKNKYNKTESSYNKSYLIVSGNGDSLSVGTGIYDAMRYDENQRDSGTGVRTDTGHETGTVYALVRNNIDLDSLLEARQSDHDLILEIYSLIVEMVSSRNKEIVIASSRYPADLVRNRFLKLGYDHINYVIDCLDKNTTKVKNIRKYLLAALFNAPVTIDGYYRAEVRHDMPGIVQGAFS